MDQGGAGDVDDGDDLLGHLLRARLDLHAAESLEPRRQACRHQDGEQKKCPAEQTQPGRDAQGDRHECLQADQLPPSGTNT